MANLTGSRKKAVVAVTAWVSDPAFSSSHSEPPSDVVDYFLEEEYGRLEAFGARIFDYAGGVASFFNNPDRKPVRHQGHRNISEVDVSEVAYTLIALGQRRQSAMEFLRRQGRKKSRKKGAKPNFGTSISRRHFMVALGSIMRMGGAAVFLCPTCSLEV